MTPQQQQQTPAPAYPTFQAPYQAPFGPAPPRSNTKLIIAIVVIAVVVVAVIGSILAIGFFNGLSNTKLPQSLNIVRATISVPAGHYYYYSFSMTSSLDSNVAVNGTFSASGGMIQTYVFNQTNYNIWQGNPNGGYSYYNSGQVSSGTISANLPNGKGLYYLVFSNAGGSNDSVTANANVNYLL